MYKEFKLTIYGICAFIIGFGFDMVAVHVAQTNLNVGGRISHIGINLVIALGFHYAMTTSRTIRNRMLFSALIALCIGKIIEEMFLCFDPCSWGWNDIVYFTIAIAYHIYRYKRLKSSEAFKSA